MFENGDKMLPALESKVSHSLAAHINNKLFLFFSSLYWAVMKLLCVLIFFLPQCFSSQGRERSSKIRDWIKWGKWNCNRCSGEKKGGGWWNNRQMYSWKVFPVINKVQLTRLCVCVCVAASHPDGFHSPTPDIRQEQKGGGSSADLRCRVGLVLSDGARTHTELPGFFPNTWLSQSPFLLILSRSLSLPVCWLSFTLLCTANIAAFWKHLISLYSWFSFNSGILSNSSAVNLCFGSFYSLSYGHIFVPLIHPESVSHDTLW